MQAGYAKAEYGASHYMPMLDGVTPQLFYKQQTVHFNDGTSETWWHYLSYCNLWIGSSISAEHIARLVPITGDNHVQSN